MESLCGSRMSPAAMKLKVPFIVPEMNRYRGDKEGGSAFVHSTLTHLQRVLHTRFTRDREPQLEYALYLAGAFPYTLPFGDRASIAYTIP